MPWDFFRPAVVVPPQALIAVYATSAQASFRALKFEAPPSPGNYQRHANPILD
jgi:hypothetical protein